MTRSLANSDGLLRNGSGKPGDGFDPLVMVTNTATEYWRKSASLLHTDARGSDVSIPDNVRFYFFASAQHFPSCHTSRLLSVNACLKDLANKNRIRRFVGR